MRTGLKSGLVALALASAGCTNDFAKNGTGDVALLMVAINGGAPFASDVQNLDSGTRADNINVILAARSKNPNNNTTNYPRAILIERYEVRYYRSDGRNVEGVDVPVRIAGDISSAIDIGDSDKNLILSVEVVRLQAKFEPPLRNLIGGNAAIVLSVQAEITIYGRTIASNDVVKATGRMQIDFSDYLDTDR